jgi:hypothetical protein
MERSQKIADKTSERIPDHHLDDHQEPGDVDVIFASVTLFL